MPTPKPKTGDVTFSLPAEIGADLVALCGEFNGWSTDALQLQRNGGYGWEATIALEPGTYRYRYLLDGYRWENAWQADAYAPNPYGSDDSILVVE